MKTFSAPGFLVQESPSIFCTLLPGKWLTTHTTPSWRAKDPERGFQRMVKEKRARAIAAAVIDQNRTFPNAIVLATDAKPFAVPSSGQVTIPSASRFLVVDGQHRLWAQTFAAHEINYTCMIHMRLQPEDMAQLFLEINDTQRRVPSSLRWDLVRLVRPESAQEALKVRVADLVFELQTRPDSPFFDSIDLTGEDTELSIRQGSLAPEIHKVLSKDAKRQTSVEDYAELLIRYFAAVRALEPDTWGLQSKSRFYKARVLRALLRVLSDFLKGHTGDLDELTTQRFAQVLKRIDPASLSPERLSGFQGAAGVDALYDLLRTQVFAKAT